MKNKNPLLQLVFLFSGILLFISATGQTYKVVDTRQLLFYDTLNIISPPSQNDQFYGQDAQFSGYQPLYQDNADGTVTDNATVLMWEQDESGTGMNWEQALLWVVQKNQANYLGYNDWRLPNIKELESIVDYSRSPQTTNSAAIDPVFYISSIIDEGGGTNYPFY